MSGTYRDLKAWQTAMDLVRDIYRLTQTFPREETYGLTIQLRRAAVSIASNIAEGKGRSSGQRAASFSQQRKRISF
jgi:four helix bundle protein